MNEFEHADREFVDDVDFKHPENDLDLHVDAMNKRPPVPHTLDELLDAPDPVMLARESKRSTRQAIWFAIAVPLLAVLVGLGSLGIFRLVGGPLCDAGTATWICSDTQRFIWMLLALVVPTVGMVGSGIIMLRKLNGYVRWLPWMGVFWFCALHFMFWGIDVLQVFLDWQLSR